MGKLLAYVVIAPPAICRSCEALHRDVVSQQVAWCLVTSIDAEDDVPGAPQLAIFQPQSMLPNRSIRLRELECGLAATSQLAIPKSLPGVKAARFGLWLPRQTADQQESRHGV